MRGQSDCLLCPETPPSFSMPRELQQVPRRSAGLDFPLQGLLASFGLPPTSALPFITVELWESDERAGHIFTVS